MKKYEAVGLSVKELKEILERQSGEKVARIDRDMGSVSISFVNDDDGCIQEDIKDFLLQEFDTGLESSIMNIFCEDGDQWFDDEIMIITRHI